MMAHLAPASFAFQHCCGLHVARALGFGLGRECESVSCASTLQPALYASA